MINEHNPIARIINQLQAEWNTEVTPNEEIQLVRWIIDPSESRLYEGLLKLESTEHGGIPDMFLVLFTPFEATELHSRHIIENWLDEFEKDKETLEAYKEVHPDFNWDPQQYRDRISNDFKANDALLAEMMSSFQEQLIEDQVFTLALFPYTVADIKLFRKWLEHILAAGPAQKTRLLIFDYKDQRYFDSLVTKFKHLAKSLWVPVDLDGAINQITTSGDPNKPDVKFRKCMVEMSNGAAKNNLTKVITWGEKGIEVTQKSGEKSLFITAHLVFAGMLFNFKEFERIEQLLNNALRLTHMALKAEDDSCRPLLVQAYGLQASLKQLQKKKEEASDLFCKQADSAIEFGFSQQPLSSWWMAYSAVKKSDKDRYKELVERAYNYGTERQEDELKGTCMTFVAADYYSIMEKENQPQVCERIDAFMKPIEGDDWRDEVEGRRKEMEKRKLSLRNWF